MTKEEAKIYIGELKAYAKSKGWDEEYQVACDMAMNDMEQENALDKVRKEIADYQKETFYSDDIVMSKRIILSIIDKHKADGSKTV